MDEGRIPKHRVACISVIMYSYIPETCRQPLLDFKLDVKAESYRSRQLIQRYL